LAQSESAKLMRRTLRAFSVAAAWVACVLYARAAHADGALPDSLGVLLPIDHPNTIMIATNFGLLSSEDAGESFRLVCEDAVGIGAALYQVGPPPEDRLFTVTLDGFSRSNDLGCSWDRKQPLDRVSDVFVDPSDPDRVLAIARTARTDAGSPAWGVFESHDAGETFGDAIFVAPSSTYLTGVEIARSDPKIVYLTMATFEGSATHPYVVRSHDGGAHWKRTDLMPSIGMQLPRILAVDPEHPERVYMRLATAGVDVFAVYDDAAGEATERLQLEDEMTAFLVRQNGALLLATRKGALFESRDHGTTFAPLDGAPHLRGLGEREGALYAATDNALDGFAVAKSEDDGRSWRGLLRFDQIAGLRECGQVEAVCADAWAMLSPTLALPDASVPDASVADAASGDRDGGDAGHAQRQPAVHGGAGCSVVRGARSCSAADAALVATVVALRRARRRRSAAQRHDQGGASS
jgi:hypothetical protein